MNKLEKVVDNLIGIPYQHNGRSLEGVDCWGLVYLVYKGLGYELPVGDGEDIPLDWYKTDPDRYIRALSQLGQEVGDYRNLQTLDIPYFRMYRDVVTHTGVMLDDEYLVHVLIKKEVRVDSIKRRIWRRKYAGAIRVIS